MKWTNPPVSHGLGKTGLLNRRGLITGTPTIRGLAGTGTREVRDQETGRPTPVSELVSAKTVATAGVRHDAVTSIWTTLSDTNQTGLFASIATTRLANTELIMIISMLPQTNLNTDGSGSNAGNFSRALTIKRGSTSLFSRNWFMSIYGVDAGDYDYGGDYTTFQYIDDDNVSGAHTYHFTLTGALGNAEVAHHGITLIERKR